MARRSNKTAHVLNLIAAGHDNQNDSTEEIPSTETSDSAVGKTEHPAAQPAKAVSAPPASPNNVSVIDTTSKDPISDLIQQQLNTHFDEPASESGKKQELKQDPEPPVTEGTVANPANEVTPTPIPLAHPESETAPAPHDKAIQTSRPETLPEPQTQTAPVTQTDAAPTPNPETIPAPQPEAAPASQTEAAKEPELTEPEPEPVLMPDFARVNVMESIVNDKIIYYMRQFDVCTCDRCIADTVALTLTGLMPKYIVTTPAAVDPLLSFYTNRLISDVTVEATKACMIVKENPRH